MQTVSNYESLQAEQLREWVDARRREHRVQPLPRTKSAEEIQMQEMEYAMTVIGLIAGACVFLCTMGLLAYWVSPWAVVSVVSLAGLIGSWAKFKGCW